MGRTLPLVLSWGLYLPPFTVVPSANMNIKALGKERAGAYGPVGSVNFLVLVVSLVQDHSPDVIQLRATGIVKVGYEGRH